jgi:formamidopyrimidine-DNA glycosylase
MPEIAEVETVRNTLKRQILQRKIIKVKVLYSKMIESDPKEFSHILVGKTFQDIKRRGKWLIFDLEDYYLISHLRMEGKYFIKNNNDPIEKHEHIIFSLDNGQDLRYHDTRKFGRMRLIKKEDIINCEEIQKQGFEPGEKGLTGSYLLTKFKNKTLPIKTILLDQTIISGLGNIYADEVLFQSKINPLKQGRNITLNEANNIVLSSQKIISEAIKMGGTTIRSYTSSLGVTGRFQNNLCVHSQEGKSCKECGTPIKRIKVNGRSTYFCPKCQQ